MENACRTLSRARADMRSAVPSLHAFSAVIERSVTEHVTPKKNNSCKHMRKLFNEGQNDPKKESVLGGEQKNQKFRREIRDPFA